MSLNVLFSTLFFSILSLSSSFFLLFRPFHSFSSPFHASSCLSSCSIVIDDERVRKSERVQIVDCKLLDDYHDWHSLLLFFSPLSSLSSFFHSIIILAFLQSSHCKWSILITNRSGRSQGKISMKERGGINGHSCKEISSSWTTTMVNEFEQVTHFICLFYPKTYSFSKIEYIYFDGGHLSRSTLDVFTM